MISQNGTNGVNIFAVEPSDEVKVADEPLDEHLEAKNVADEPMDEGLGQWILAKPQNQAVNPQIFTELEPI